LRIRLGVAGADLITFGEDLCWAVAHDYSAGVVVRVTRTVATEFCSESELSRMLAQAGVHS